MSTKFDYWHESVSCALEDAALTATDDQIKSIAESIEGAHDCYGMAFGHDVESSNLSAQSRAEANEIRQRLEYEQTVPRDRCDNCKGHGHRVDGWGRKHPCGDCGGRGFIPAYPFRMEPPR